MIIIPYPIPMTSSNSNKGGARQVLLPSGQLGTGLRILGGRGNGYFIQSDRQSNRSLQSGDEILAIGNRELDKMNYAEVKELLASFKEKGKCIIQVKSNLQGQFGGNPLFSLC